MGQKRKFQVSNNESPLQDDKWVQFRDRALEIKPRQSSEWVDIRGVPVQQGLSTSVCWKDVFLNVMSLLLGVSI